MLQYRQINNEKLMEYARKCIETAIPIKDYKAMADGYRFLGIGFYRIAQYDSAIHYHSKVFETAERMRNYPKKYEEPNIEWEISVAYGNIANIFTVQGKYHEALEYYQKTLKIFEQYDWQRSQLMVHQNMGDMYYSMNNYEQAEISYSKLEALAYQLNDTLSIADAKYGLCMILWQNGDYDKALQNAIIVQDYYSRYHRAIEFQVSILNILAGIYLQGYDDDRRAEEYIRQAIQITDSMAVQVTEKSASLRWLSAIYLKRGEWRKAEQTALEALATDDSEPAKTLAIYGILAKTYTHLGNAAKSNEYFDKHNALQASWSSRHYQSAIREMEVKYETEKKETRIAALESERRLWYGLAIAGGAIVLLSLVALFFVWRWTKKRQQLLATQAVLDGETAERTRIARDLHDGLGSLLSSIRYNMKDISAVAMFSPADVARWEKSLNLLDQSTDELRRVAYRIVHELVANALKHSAATRILVQIVQEPGRIALMVEDNGCGFDAKRLKKEWGCRIFAPV
jgi:signal transduction histidine kinase